MLALDAGRTVVSLAYSADGRTLAAGGWEGVGLWDLSTGRERFLPTTPNTFSFGATVSPDGRLVAWAAAGRHAVARTDPLARFGRDVAGQPVLFGEPVPHGLLADGRLVFLHADGSRLFDPATGRLDTPLATGRTDRVAVCPAGDWLAVADETVWVCPLGPAGRGEAVRLPTARRRVSWLGFCGPGRLWFTDAAGRVSVWDAAAGDLLADRVAVPGRVLAVAPDGRLAVSRTADRVIALIDLGTGHEVRRYDWQVGLVDAVAVAPDGLTAAAAGPGGVIAVFDLD